MWGWRRSRKLVFSDCARMRARPKGPADRPPSTIPPRSGPTKEAHRRAMNRSGGLLRSEAGRASRGRSRARDDQQGKQRERQNHSIRALTCSYGAEVGFEPTTFRLRVGPKSSNWTRPDPSRLLRSGTDSIWTRPVPPSSSAWVAREVATSLPWRSELASNLYLEHPIAIGRSQLAATPPPAWRLVGYGRLSRRATAWVMRWSGPKGGLVDGVGAL
jgi:hypothetical protein